MILIEEKHLILYDNLMDRLSFNKSQDLFTLSGSISRAEREAMRIIQKAAITYYNSLPKTKGGET